MRLRLFLSFLLLILITTLSVVILARWQAVTGLRNFASRGGFAGQETLVNSLENYFEIQNSWDGVSALFPNRQGQGGQGAGSGQGFHPPESNLILADVSYTVVLDSGQPTLSPTAMRQLTDDEKERAIILRVNRQIVGYLIPDERPALAPDIEDGLIRLLNRGAILAATISGVLAVALALILGYVLLRPVRALTHAAAALGQGDMTQRVTVEGDDEIAGLATTFNLMAESLQQAEARRKAMTADIAHELRTPLAVQRANIEAIQDGIYALSNENLQPVYEQTLLLERLVDDLRTLALADSGQIELIRTETDIPGLVQRVVEQFQPHAGMRGHQILIAPSQTGSCPTVNADPGRVEQILGNLLTNALRHTPDGGQITVAVSCTPDRVQIAVRDTGPGIPEDTLPHIFERFYRGDRSRSRMEGGTGLGLSIARRLAEAHDGLLTAANAPEGGAVFTLELPYR